MRALFLSPALIFLVHFDLAAADFRAPGEPPAWVRARLAAGIPVRLPLGALLKTAAEDKVSDDILYDTVRRRLANDRDVRGGAIEVEVKDGVVTLRGKVREEKQKQKAERIAKKVKGVRKVINELTVGTAVE